MIVQVVSGQSYADYIRENIFSPLEMQHSFASQDDAMQAGMAMGHRWWFGVPVAAIQPNNNAELPAGFLISSAEDMAHFLIAQMNGGRYREKSVLSPEGIALMHSEPAPKTYGLGWESIRANGHRLVNHDGGTSNFQASLFFDPETQVGVFIAANVVNALDTFSSPPGSSPLDGPTVRAMAQSVLSLVSDQPIPHQGPGNFRLTLAFDLLILALTSALILSWVRIPKRYQRLRQRGVPRWSDLARRSGMVAGLHFVWPAGLFYLALKNPAWKTLVLFQPDLGYWLEAVAVVVFLKGLLEVGLLGQVFRQTRRRKILQPV